MATLVMISVTLVAGAAVFGWVNSQVVITDVNLSNHANEQESIPIVFFNSNSQITVYIDNYGSIPLSQYTVVIAGP